MSGMSQTREKIMLSLKNDKSHALKGKLDLLNKIRKQKEANALRAIPRDNQFKIDQTTDSSVESVILKQQNLLSKLNSENMGLIEENEKLRKTLCQRSNESKQDLLVREQSLKQQLHLSQQYSIHFLNKYFNVLKD